MNRYQSVALAKHCRLAGECVRPEFASRVGPFWSVVLTVNSGYE